MNADKQSRMPSSTDFPTWGKVIEVKDGVVVFNPRGTTYELHLKVPAGAALPELNAPVQVLIRANGRKVWTVPSGGNFIVPIQGPPRIVQGRVKYADDRQVLVHAGASVIVDLPAAESAIDLPNGAIAVGTMVNATLLPGATVEFVESAVATRR